MEQDKDSFFPKQSDNWERFKNLKIVALIIINPWIFNVFQWNIMKKICDHYVKCIESNEIQRFSSKTKEREHKKCI